MSKIKVAVIGYGHLGKWHSQKADSFKDSVQFVAIVERTPEGQKLARDNHPDVQVITDIKEVIDDIDAAVVVTPTSTHFELVKFLLENNKHVFCEKPLCSNDEEGKLLHKISQEKNVVLQVGHSERFHEAWEILKEKFKSLKSPYKVKINRVAPFKGRATDVDVVQDLGIHDLDLILHLFEDRPQSINALGFKIRTSKWDHADIDIELENNSRAQIIIGRNGTKEIRELEVISQNGMITVDLFTNKILSAPHNQFEDGSFVQEKAYEKRDHLLLEHKHFYDSIKNNEKAIVGIKDGLNAVHLVDCTLKSLESKSKVLVNLV